ncbi:formin-like protein 14 isoform X2 [Centruroides sculpturatus]|uniref:formin-like protein 14 isoform X2 n=1 Tax=Centruroides sculpturatus TaxID=218467 RepID=UPI000C6EAC7A|nr:formin-like protein 14 isoform X2 [Centruroides sculpturatus]
MIPVAPISVGNATSYFRSHKSPRKLQLKEVHQTDEAAKLKVFNSEGITLAETTETNKKQEKIIHNEPPQVPPRRIQKQPVTPIIRQPPTRPPPPPPPSVPSSPQSELDDQQNCEESVNNLSLQNGNVHYTRCASPDLPLPPPPSTDTELCVPDEPLPPPPDLNDVEILGRSLGQNSL